MCLHKTHMYKHTTPYLQEKKGREEGEGEWKREREREERKKGRTLDFILKVYPMVGVTQW